MNRRNKAILAKNIRNKIWQTSEVQGVYAGTKMYDELGKKSREERKILKQKKSKENDYNEILVATPGTGKKA